MLITRRQADILRVCILLGGLSLACPAHAQDPVDRLNSLPRKAQDIPVTPRVREGLPIRLGGVFTAGLGALHLTQADSDWIAANCDVAAFHPDAVLPGTFPAMRAHHPLFTPLLLLSAASTYEQPGHPGALGLYTPTMGSWTLRDAADNEVRHPDPGGHWMDFGDQRWAEYWRTRASALVAKYGALGIAISEFPPGNSFVEGSLKRYGTTQARASAALSWLQTVRKGSSFFLIPSSIGFDLVYGHPTTATAAGTEEPALSGRIWDAFQPVADGSWSEGWLRPYWIDGTVSREFWEIELEAADRASRNGQIFIAAGAYSNDVELEYELASYLLVVHHQGRLVFQPMPVSDSGPRDAGFSVAVFRREVARANSYFNTPIGAGVQERHPLATEGGTVWRRAFQHGDVYVNPSDVDTVQVLLGGKMLRVDGATVRHITLAPHTGVILRYPEDLK